MSQNSLFSKVKVAIVKKLVIVRRTLISINLYAQQFSVNFGFYYIIVHLIISFAKKTLSKFLLKWLTIERHILIINTNLKQFYLTLKCKTYSLMRPFEWYKLNVQHAMGSW